MSVARKPGSALALAAAAAPASTLWAIAYTDVGLHPIRLRPPKRGDKGSGKAPVELGWQTRSLDLYDLCSELYAKPRSNLGLRMGMQRDGTAVVALDEDVRGALSTLSRQLGPLPRTMRTDTGRGKHLFYRIPPDVLPRLRNFTKREGIDLKADRGQVVAAPSVHYSGAVYRTKIRPIADLPSAWLDWLLQGSPRAADGTREAPTADGLAALHDRELDVSALLPHLAPAGTPDGRHELGRALGGWAGKLGFRPDAVARAVRALPADDPDSRAYQAQQAAERARLLPAETPGWEYLARRFDEGTLAALEEANADPWVKRFAERQARRSANAANDVGEDERHAGRDAAVDNVIQTIAAPSVNVFQRAGMLCTVTREARAGKDCVRPVGTPTIRALQLARLREIVRTCCGHKLESHAIEVAARGEWEHIRPLDAIATYPIMRRDGSLLLASGYDADTRTLASIDVQIAVPPRPTQEDARKALALLEDLVSDFPFASAEARSAWLAMLLTVPARPAIDGPTPLGLLEATQRGSGKTLLADLISLITTGAPVPRRVAPKTKEEWDKTMLATLAAGDSLVLIDNVTTMLVSDALDAVLTGTTYSGRWLGVSENRTVAVRTVFFASSNNARLSTDLVRRSIACRLEPGVERPEAREDFRYPDLEGHVRAHRAELLGAVLTIVRAYAVADRPRVYARRMGSYDAWCRVVRDALVWAGAADPAETQDALRETADVERDELRELLTAWHAAIGNRAVTVRDILSHCESGTGDFTKRNALLDALRANMPNGAEPTKHAIGNKLRTLRGQIADGLALQPGKPDKHAKTATWRVVRVR